MITMNVPDLLEHARQKVKVGRYEDAVALYGQVLLIDKTNATAMENTGRALYYL